MSEADIPNASLVIHHYRTVSRKDISRKCNFLGKGHTAGYHEVNPKKCEAMLLRAWHPDVYDSTMLQKIKQQNSLFLHETVNHSTLCVTC
mmetsp:Transcript_70351/g.103080  ORF Transcript_70351/g.103080 Transcript_70351/m.103080 type:complete len:90 (-) Transcript_70351:819-1088(-)